MKYTSLSNLASQLIGPSVLATNPSDEQLTSYLSRKLGIHAVMRGDNLVLVAHPTPGQPAVALKFPFDSAKLTQAVEQLKSDANLEAPRIGIGFTNVASGPVMKLRLNLSGMQQLHEQLTMALEHHDFDFEAFTYQRVDGGGTHGLLVDFLPDGKGYPAAEPAPTRTEKVRTAMMSGKSPKSSPKPKTPVAIPIPGADIPEGVPLK